MVTILLYASYSIGYGFETQSSFSPMVTEISCGSAQENYGIISKNRP
jgi:hypothetical protein